MWQRLYTAVFYLLLPVIIGRLLWRSRRAPAYRQRWRERFGDCPWRLDNDSIWIHAVSVGESEAALPLVRELKQTYPDTTIIVTTTTPTGSALIRKALGNDVLHGYLPYDLPACVRRFLVRSRPRLAIIMETELWPNLFHQCRQRDIPIVIANARLSERSASRYQMIRGLLTPLLQNISLIACQSAQDSERFARLGAQRQQLQITGNIKFDRPLPTDLDRQARELQRLWRDEGTTARPCWLAASTHEGEEEIVIEAYERIRRQVPALLLIIVPRHPERFTDVTERCLGKGYEVIRRSRCNTAGAAAGKDILIGDSMGELLAFYAAADVTFVGGSLIPRGGHNVLEPAAAGCPMVFGQHMFNFGEISQTLLERNAAIGVSDGNELAAAISDLLTQPERRSRQAARAAKVVKQNQGALQATIRAMAPFLRQ